jgi:hypothetical protein
VFVLGWVGVLGMGRVGTSSGRGALLSGGIGGGEVEVRTGGVGRPVEGRLML